MKRLYTISLIIFLGSGLYACRKNPTVNPIPTTNMTVKDTDNNVYNVVKIGNQYWTAENARMTHFRDGTPIRNLTMPDDWKNPKTATDSAAWCYPRNTINADTQKLYGKLYNWYAVADPRKLAPRGYHVASNDDWDSLTNTLTKNQEGQELKAAQYWKDDVDINKPGRNTTKFTALPSGYRTENSKFEYIDYYAFFWSTTASSNNLNNAFFYSLSYQDKLIPKDVNSKNRGYAVRFVKDASP
ncbi:MAG TPA: fibrobacter succinogenes major paralogous domain-containing protein [Chitinophagaceae bacterium]|nr:fibrobacter succinogenes major paralogous domain-containing protein [Chitinophagaceae bacterium]